MSRFIRLLNLAFVAVEVTVTAVLLALAVAVLFALVMSTIGLVGTPGTLSTEQFYRVVGLVLEVFVVVELFRIAVAYMKHENVIPTVLEAALVAVARKFVVFEKTDDVLAQALGLSAMLIAVAVTRWLLYKANACELQT